MEFTHIGAFIIGVIEQVVLGFKMYGCESPLLAMTLDINYSAVLAFIVSSVNCIQQFTIENYHISERRSIKYYVQCITSSDM